MILRLYLLLARPTKASLGATLLPTIAFTSVSALLAIVLGGAQTFWTYTNNYAYAYQFFAVLALTLLGIPLISLGGAAAKLSARRRDHRLASLRLLGATANTTSALAVIEATMFALVGSIAGVIISYGLSPLIGLIPFRGHPLGASAVMLSPSVALVLIFTIVLIATLSAVMSLRLVRISPLGVATKQQAPTVPWLPLVIAVTGIIIAATLVNNLALLGGLAGISAGFGIALAITLFAIDVVGTWILAFSSRRRVKKVQKPAQLLGLRAILESPRAAWRQVSGVSMASFVAVFAGSGIALLDLAGTQNIDVEGGYLISDIRTGVIIVIIGTFLMVACNVGVNQAAQILDRADISRSLAVMGAPLKMENKARKQSTLRPLLLASVGSATLAAILLFPLLGLALVLSPLTLLTVLGTVVIGFALVLGVLAATTPLLRKTAEA